MNRKKLVVVLILLLIGTSVNQITAQKTEKFQPISRDDRLYIGGNGPGNYTKIQEDTIPLTQANTDYFSNAFVIIIGKCNTVTSHTLLWLFGFKLLINKRVEIRANGDEGEVLNALVLPSKIGFYFGYKNILINIQHATGLFFWGEKSFVLQKASQRIFAICKARNIYVTYEKD